MSLRFVTCFAAAVTALAGSFASGAEPASAEIARFTKQHCTSCHNGLDRQGGLDLKVLRYTPDDAENFALWVKIHDRVQAGEMPPKDADRPSAADSSAFVKALEASLVAADKQVVARDGRASQRRLNRYEFESAVRDLLRAPWLAVKNELPEDGEAELFNKIGDALDVSHVQITRFMQAANTAMRQVMTVELLRQELPPPTTVRFWARQESTLTRTFHGGAGGRFNRQSPERSTFPVLGFEGQPDVRARRAPLTVGDSDPAVRELEAVGWNRGNYHPFHTIWNNFRAPVAGKYRVRWCGYTIWTGPHGVSAADVGGADENHRKPKGRWNSPDGDTVSRGRRNESITVYAQGPIDVRRVGQFDLTPEPTVYDLGEITLLQNESLVTDAARFFRDRPGSAGNPLAQRDGQPAVAFRWMEIEGPLYDDSSTAGYRTLFGDLPLARNPKGEIALTILSSSKERGPQGAGGYGNIVRTEDCPVAVVSKEPRQDAERLLRAFLGRAYRRPVHESELQRYLALVMHEMNGGHDFAYSMLAGYTAIICSPPFLFLEEEPGRLNAYALASRLSFFLWNSPPDEPLLARARAGELVRSDVLHSEVERMLSDPRSRRFLEAFLDYWLDLRKHDATTPSNTLYPDYYLDEELVEASLDESRLFFTELLERDLPARTLIDSDFTYLNERLAKHYGISGVEGGRMRRVSLPTSSVRGGVMTQAIVLKVTANGTTTSPVVRGKWISERMLGQIVPPPPSGVPAVDPDTRGAVTIRQQLEKHRADVSCAVCHDKIDPQGFALENFDVMGGWRDRYRGDAKDKVPEIGLGKNGWPFDFHYALAVESQGRLPDGRTFNDVREFKRLMIQDQPQIARNLARHLLVCATGARIRFSDRAAVEQILQQTTASDYGVRSLVHAIAQSDLFLNK
jgi:uncharacterized protein DUF1592/uncharacterized protein DUF1588/uncharacterized protein DUF1585/uncharacterized protein DUF1587/uncharacterized protein DUF1595/cytochrome c